MHRSTPDLSVVMPVYNEAEAISGVVASWISELENLGIQYEFLIYDDGSRDSTLGVLRQTVNGTRNVMIQSHANRGHGPTILRGYREAQGDWVFQTDSDNEMSPASFGQLWSRREQFDLLLGYRAGRKFSVGRRIITQVSRATIHTLFGRAIRDVNVPYRLIRRSCLKEMLPDLPPETCAPNVLMSGFAAVRGLRVFEYPVPHSGRKTGAALPALRFWKLAARSFGQTIEAALKARR